MSDDEPNTTSAMTLTRADTIFTPTSGMQWATKISGGRTKLTLGYDGVAKLDPDMTPDEALVLVKHLAEGWPEMLRSMREHFTQANE